MPNVRSNRLSQTTGLKMMKERIIRIKRSKQRLEMNLLIYRLQMSPGKKAAIFKSRSQRYLRAILCDSKSSNGEELPTISQDNNQKVRYD